MITSEDPSLVWGSSELSRKPIKVRYGRISLSYDLISQAPICVTHVHLRRDKLLCHARSIDFSKRKQCTRAPTLCKIHIELARRSIASTQSRLRAPWHACLPQARSPAPRCAGERTNVDALFYKDALQGVPDARPWRTPPAGGTFGRELGVEVHAVQACALGPEREFEPLGRQRGWFGEEVVYWVGVSERTRRRAYHRFATSSGGLGGIGCDNARGTGPRGARGRGRR